MNSEKELRDNDQGATTSCRNVVSDNITAHDICAGTPQRKSKIRQINIEELSRGFIVRVGCQTFAVSTKKELVSELLTYIDDPAETERRWEADNLF